MVDSAHFPLQQTIIKMVNAIDTKQWKDAKSHFDEEVTVDYSSLNHQPKANVARGDLVGGWQHALEKASTHHMVSNFDYSLQGDVAFIECHVYACHQADGFEGWDCFGRYQFELVERQGKWFIAAMTLIVHGQKGNPNFLAQLQGA
ncbi:nuclear transport factor 2 family protein [Vibrio sp. SM6]|uniref:Nuclear transport factor 2 family protein n=1 Tax=Vibrio agarilyticus TaxID=2726741 RepID=A0A7X8YF65_9VIBR|nr:nuclear transport factor 2 family protein [Vibrio agarilyticus]NLS11528.1 nuclear transport factor 2 family protein [Vibrio agarilyticus]